MYQRIHAYVNCPGLYCYFADVAHIKGLYSTNKIVGFFRIRLMKAVAIYVTHMTLLYYGRIIRLA